jgi:CO/xanthine dehydrogenase Mo-binding subunit
MLVEGQIEGGVAMGIGYALSEEIIFQDGVQVNPSFTDYVLPTPMDVPPIDVVLVEKIDPTGPFGAKGVGEPTLVPTAAAILNAIYDAVGARIYSLPATPEKVLRALSDPPPTETV